MDERTYFKCKAKCGIFVEESDIKTVSKKKKTTTSTTSSKSKSTTTASKKKTELNFFETFKIVLDYKHPKKIFLFYYQIIY